jgi:hypothetical protein
VQVMLVALVGRTPVFPCNCIPTLNRADARGSACQVKNAPPSGRKQETRDLRNRITDEQV